MNDVLQQLINQFMPFAQEHIGFEYPPKLFLKRDQKNANDPLGKTAFYDPEAKSITLYISGRHPKDILRSLGHELVHHKQNCCGEFEDTGDMGPGYAQRDPHLRDMEEKANLHGSMCLRDFEDLLKKENTIYYEHLLKGEKSKMSIKDWKNKEISILLSEAWGFKFNSLQEFDEFNGTGEVQEEAAEEIKEGPWATPSPRDRKKPAGTGERVEPDPPPQPATPPKEEEELEEATDVADAEVQEEGCPAKDDDAEPLEENEDESAEGVVEATDNTEQLKEMLKKVINIVKEQKMKGKSKN
jgi:hypothetical protein